MRILQADKTTKGHSRLERFLKFLITDFLPTTALLLVFAACMIWINNHL